VGTRRGCEFAFSQHDVPEFWSEALTGEGAGAILKRGRRECRALNAPAASRAMVKSTRVSHHRYAATRHSLRNGFNGFLRALPGDRALLPPSSARCESGITSVRCEASSPVMRWHPRQLDASVGASGPHDFAVCGQHHSSSGVAASIASCTQRP
jgi:hypothetical protein